MLCGREKHPSPCFSQVDSGTAVQGCPTNPLSFTCLLFVVQVSLSFPTPGSQQHLPKLNRCPSPDPQLWSEQPCWGPLVFWELLLLTSPWAELKSKEPRTQVSVHIWCYLDFPFWKEDSVDWTKFSTFSRKGLLQNLRCFQWDPGNSCPCTLWTESTCVIVLQKGLCREGREVVNARQLLLDEVCLMATTSLKHCFAPPPPM